MRRLPCAATVATSSSVGTASCGAAPDLSLRRRALSSAAVRSPTGPEPEVVRSSVASWMTMTSPSRERCTSNSMKSAPRTTAFLKASRLFSGQRSAPPRCAARSVAGEVCGAPAPTIAATTPTVPALQPYRASDLMTQPLVSSRASAPTSLLALDEALHEPALHEDDDGHRGQERHHRPGHDEVPRGELGASARGQLPETDHDGPHRFGIGDQDRPEVLVPAEDEEDHEERGDIRPRQWQQELEEEANGAGAVELGRFGKLIGNGHVELTEQEGRGGRGHERHGQPLVGIDPA